MKLYGQKTNLANYPLFYHKLKIIEGKSYLGINYSLSEIECLQISGEEFDLFLYVILCHNCFAIMT